MPIYRDNDIPKVEVYKTPLLLREMFDKKTIVENSDVFCITDNYDLIKEKKGLAIKHIEKRCGFGIHTRYRATLLNFLVDKDGQINSCIEKNTYKVILVEAVYFEEPILRFPELKNKFATKILLKAKDNK